MLPVYKSVLYTHDEALSRAASIFTIHNLAYQGKFDYSVLDEIGLPGWLYTMDKLECYGRVNFLKAGIVFSEYTSSALTKAVKRAVETYANRQEWKRLVATALAGDYSWCAQASRYVEAIEMHRRQPLTAFLDEVRPAA